MSTTPKNRQAWSAWSMRDDEVRVQINQPDLARAFAQVKGVWPAGYSVAGNFMRLFHVKQPVHWVDAWMKKYGVSGAVQKDELN